jgi:hypothetical protein
MRIALIGFYLRHGWNIKQILAPHGATSGCDPFTAYSNLDHSNFFGYIHDAGDIFLQSTIPDLDPDPQSGVLHRAFIDAFGQRKCPRHGESDAIQLCHTLNDDSNIEAMERDRKSMRARMSHIFRTLVNQASDQRRVIFVCFCRAVPVMLQRLEEVASVLNNVYLVGLPYPDDTNTVLRNLRSEPEEVKHQILVTAHIDSYQEYQQLLSVDHEVAADLGMA